MNDVKILNTKAPTTIGELATGTVFKFVEDGCTYITTDVYGVNGRCVVALHSGVAYSKPGRCHATPLPSHTLVELTVNKGQ
jgi:hypothetical protein